MVVYTEKGSYNMPDSSFYNHVDELENKYLVVKNNFSAVFTCINSKDSKSLGINLRLKDKTCSLNIYSSCYTTVKNITVICDIEDEKVKTCIEEIINDDIPQSQKSINFQILVIFIENIKYNMEKAIKDTKLYNIKSE